MTLSSLARLFRVGDVLFFELHILFKKSGSPLLSSAFDIASG